MTRSSGDLVTDGQLWGKTLAEVDAGWLSASHPWEDLEEEASVSRRFPLVQSTKIRPIDDYSQSQVNSTVTLHEKPTMNNPDVYAPSFYTSCSSCPLGIGRQTLWRALWIWLQLIVNYALLPSLPGTHTCLFTIRQLARLPPFSKLRCLLDHEQRSMPS